MEQVSESVVEIPLEKIVVPDWRIRKEVLKDKSFEELKESIKVNGELQSVEVQPLDGGKYEIVFGVRRYAAVQELGWKTIKAIVRSRGDLERQMAEVAENVHRLPYNSKQMALAIAKYARLVAVLGQKGRPEALAPEQLEKAKEMREQGKSLGKIAEELGVAKATVHKHLKEAEGSPSVQKISTESTISERPLEQETIAEPEIKEAPIVSGVRGVAGGLHVSHEVVARGLRAEFAIKKYPALERLEKVSDILELVKVADFLEASPKEVEGAVKLVLDRGLDPVVAMHMQRVAKKHWNGIFKVYEDGKFSVEWLREAVSLMRCNPEKDWPVDMALKAVTHAHKEYKVRFWNYMAVRALGEAASKVGLTEEQYIAIAALEKLHMEGFLSDIAFDEFVRVVKEGGYRPQI
jgi:ParB-like chromosome segregation protein Spo0J